MKPLRVLIVDDDQSDCYLYRRSLQQSETHAFEFEETASAEEGVELYQRNKPDIVLLDYRLTGQDGLWFLDQIGGTTKTMLPVVMLTGGDEEQIAFQAIDRGAQAYLVKNEISIAKLHFAVIQVYQRMQLLAEIEAQREHLSRARKFAEDANVAKSAFLANMSHEIRTPLTAILGFTENLTLDIPEAERQATVDTILRNGNHLLQLINDLLDLSKIESGHLEIESIEFDPVALFSEVIELVRPPIQKKGLQVEFHALSPLPRTIKTDPLRVRQVLINLFSNATKFTESGTIVFLVHCEATPGEEKISCSVLDSGIGISPERVDAIFQPFTQAESGTTRLFGGTGLGLSISQVLAQRLGGDLKVASKEGWGSTFCFEFNPGPLADVELRDIERLVPSRTPRQTVSEEIQIDAHVLIVDDRSDNRRLVDFILTRAGADTATAVDGLEAIAAYQHAESEQRPFDIILMDMQMPSLDGPGATRKLRELGCTTPIIALTANATPADRNSCLDSGANDFVTKPIQRKRFLATVRQCIEEAQNELS